MKIRKYKKESQYMFLTFNKIIKRFGLESLNNQRTIYNLEVFLNKAFKSKKKTKFQKKKVKEWIFSFQMRFFEIARKENRNLNTTEYDFIYKTKITPHYNQRKIKLEAKKR